MYDQLEVLQNLTKDLKDTSKEIEILYRQKLMALDPETRVILGAGMFNVAKSFILASISESLSPTDRKLELFKRLYQKDLKSDVFQLFVEKIKAYTHERP